MTSAVGFCALAGVVAAWTYEKFHVDPALDAVVDHFYVDVIGRFWPPERRYVEAGYRDLPFPLAEEPAPAFTLATEWDLEQALGYFGSWSAVQRYRDSTGTRSPAGAASRAGTPLGRPVAPARVAAASAGWPRVIPL